MRVCACVCVCAWESVELACYTSSHLTSPHLALSLSALVQSVCPLPSVPEYLVLQAFHPNLASSPLPLLVSCPILMSDHTQTPGLHCICPVRETIMPSCATCSLKFSILITCLPTQALKMARGRMPLYIAGDEPNPKQLANFYGVQRHMIDTGMCKMAYDDNEEEYEEFYDYPDDDEDMGEHAHVTCIQIPASFRVFCCASAYSGKPSLCSNLIYICALAVCAVCPTSTGVGLHASLWPHTGAYILSPSQGLGLPKPSPHTLDPLPLCPDFLPPPPSLLHCIAQGSSFGGLNSKCALLLRR